MFDASLVLCIVIFLGTAAGMWLALEERPARIKKDWKRKDWWQ